MVRVIRDVGPSVALVTSVLTTTTTTTTSANTTNTSSNNDYTLPLGRSLGSGSAFVVDSGGYLCTNYHVIEFAHQIQQMQASQHQMLDEFRGNLSAVTGLNLPTREQWRSWRQEFFGSLPGGGRFSTTTTPKAQVYVRINSKTKYLPCRIVDVVPDLDIAVLKIEDQQNGATVVVGNNLATNNNDPSSTDLLRSIPFGSSSDLLVGQQLIAIGNPFGLDNTVTTGVVSALNRELQVGRTRTTLKTIRNCIQSDCAINPGNSGGPLLNRRGQVVGVNTAIVSTSGSSAGIGFAVPSDLVQPAIRDSIRRDKHRTAKPSPFLGVRIVRGGGGGTTAADTAAESSSSPLLRTPASNWITAVQPGSPAANAGMRPLHLDASRAKLESGDAIVALGGNTVHTYDELQRELDQRVVGEQVAVTLEDLQGERRVVYVTLAAAPPQ